MKVFKHLRYLKENDINPLSPEAVIDDEQFDADSDDVGYPTTPAEGSGTDTEAAAEALADLMRAYPQFKSLVTDAVDGADEEQGISVAADALATLMREMPEFMELVQASVAVADGEVDGDFDGDDDSFDPSDDDFDIEPFDDTDISDDELTTEETDDDEDFDTEPSDDEDFDTEPSDDEDFDTEPSDDDEDSEEDTAEALASLTLADWLEVLAKID